MKIILLCIVLSIPLHATDFDKALQELYHNKPHLQSTATAPKPVPMHAAQTTPSRTQLNQYAGSIALIYALIKIGHMYYTAQPPSAWNVAYYLPTFLQSARFLGNAIQISLEALLIKTTIYHLMLVYYGGISDAIADSMESIKSCIFW